MKPILRETPQREISIIEISGASHAMIDSISQMRSSNKSRRAYDPCTDFTNCGRWNFGGRFFLWILQRLHWTKVQVSTRSFFQIGTGFSSGNSLNGTSTQPNSTNVFNTLLITIADKLEVSNSGGTMISSNRTKEFQGGSRHSIATRTGMEGNAEEGLFIQLL